MKTVLKIAAGLAAVAALGAGHAQAATWLLDYTATNGGAPSEANLTVKTTDVLNAVGGYDITSITGNVDGDAVTGLIDNPAQPFTSYSADGMFIFDNVYYANQTTLLSNPGIFFMGASGHEYNLFADNETTYELYQAVPAGWYSENSVGTLSATKLNLSPLGGNLDSGFGAVPEPATWALMIAGFGGIGALMRRKRARRALAAA
jgi:hypothetical protein